MKFLVVLLATVLTACSDSGAKQQEKKAAKDAAPAAVPVTIVPAAPREVPVSFEAVARTEGSREVQVRARVTGILEKQLYNEGDAVAAGAPLFRIERAPFEIELAQARGVLAQEIARRDLAQQEAERWKGLVERRAISQKEADQAASSLQTTSAAVQIARARVRQAELNLSYTEVNAPIGGITGRALQSVGTLVQPNNDTGGVLEEKDIRSPEVVLQFSVTHEARTAAEAPARHAGVKRERLERHATEGDVAVVGVDAVGVVAHRGLQRQRHIARLPQHARAELKQSTSAHRVGEGVRATVGGQGRDLRFGQFVTAEGQSTMENEEDAALRLGVAGHGRSGLCLRGSKPK